MSYPYVDPLTKVETFYDLDKGIPQAISQSNKPWEPVENFVPENYRRQPEADLKDEQALTADFENETPNLDIIRRRAQYRPKAWFNCIPREQRYLILTTYGPAEQGYDIDCPKVGWDFFGGFETLEEVADQIQNIRMMNPHAVFLPFRVLDVGMGKRIQFPPPNDGNVKKTHINKFHEEIMAPFLKNQVRDKESLDERVEESLEDLKERNRTVKEYNEKLLEHSKKIILMTPKERSERRKKSALKLQLETIDKETAALPIAANPNGLSVIAQSLLEKQKSMTYDQVTDYIETQEKLSALPTGYRAVYRTFINEKGEESLVRSVQYLG